MNLCCPLYLSFWDTPGDVSTFCDLDISHGSDGNGGTTASGFSIRLSLGWWLPSNGSLRSWPSSGRKGTNSSWYPIEISSEEWLERLFDLSELASAENTVFVWTVLKGGVPDTSAQSELWVSIWIRYPEHYGLIKVSPSSVWIIKTIPRRQMDCGSESRYNEHKKGKRLTSSVVWIFIIFLSLSTFMIWWSSFVCAQLLCSGCFVVINRMVHFHR